MSPGEFTTLLLCNFRPVLAELLRREPTLADVERLLQQLQDRQLLLPGADGYYPYHRSQFHSLVFEQDILGLRKAHAAADARVQALREGPLVGFASWDLQVVSNPSARSLPRWRPAESPADLAASGSDMPGPLKLLSELEFSPGTPAYLVGRRLNRPYTSTGRLLYEDTLAVAEIVPKEGEALTESQAAAVCNLVGHYGFPFLPDYGPESDAASQADYFRCFAQSAAQLKNWSEHMLAGDWDDFPALAQSMAASMERSARSGLSIAFTDPQGYTELAALNTYLQRIGHQFGVTPDGKPYLDIWAPRPFYRCCHYLADLLQRRVKLLRCRGCGMVFAPTRGNHVYCDWCRPGRKALAETKRRASRHRKVPSPS